jgi:ubiquinone/menaquinone biosynthesis C-methylase UbiE
VSAGTDRYERFTATEAYRTGRIRKAAVISHLCAPYLGGSARAADLGAGTGIIRKALEGKTGNPIYGLEIDATFIVERERMVRGDVLSIPFASESLDFAMLNHLYEHVPDAGQMFRETYRVLKPGGRAYVTAGSRRAVIEPHYRLPFLSWLPAGAAGTYLRLTRRGRSYDDIRFLTYRPLTRLMRSAGFIVHDVTELAIDDLIRATWGAGWAAAWGWTRRLPNEVRGALLRNGSPQWFFFLERPPRPPDEGGAAE